ncbi:MAG: hypothetical protein HY608_05880 [Planctomycetes bacterium]|nr:hypothetical protein [Planctomycetota bacterium]
MTAHRLRNCLLALGLLASASVAWADVEHKIVLRVPTQAIEIAPGGTARIPVSAVIEPEWHIFSALRTGMSQKTVFTLTTPGYEILSIHEEEPHEVAYDWDPSGETKDWQFEGTALFHLEIRAPRDAAPGEATLEGTLSYQTCNAEGCLFPDPLPFTIPLRVTGGGATPASVGSGPRREPAPAPPPPRERNAHEGELPWRRTAPGDETADHLADALAQASRDGKRVFIDFTAPT